MESKQNINAPEVVATFPCGNVDMPSTEGVLYINDMDNSKEIWKDVKGYEDYQVSNLGRVKSLDRVVYEHNGIRRSLKGKILKPYFTIKGYASINLSKNGKVNVIRLHRVVANTFIENTENLPEINHIDEIKSNNCIDNLEWCTHLYNIRHGTGVKRSAKSRIGIIGACGEKTGTSKLKESQVIKIYNDPRGYKKLGKVYGVDWSTIRNIKKKRTWKHIHN